MKKRLLFSLLISIFLASCETRPSNCYNQFENYYYSFEELSDNYSLMLNVSNDNHKNTFELPTIGDYQLIYGIRGVCSCHEFSRRTMLDTETANCKSYVFLNPFCKFYNNKINYNYCYVWYADKSIYNKDTLTWIEQKFSNNCRYSLEDEIGTSLVEVECYENFTSTDLVLEFLYNSFSNFQE